MDIVPEKKVKIDYEDDEDQDWFSYLHENLEKRTPLGSPFPDSSWNYERKDSIFDHKDALKKPDDELHWEVMKKLYESKCVDASLIIVIVLNGNVQLNGKVHSGEAKKTAEDTVSKLPGVWRVENLLKVEQPS